MYTCNYSIYTATREHSNRDLKHRVLVLKKEEEEEVSLRVEIFFKKVRINSKSHSNILPALLLLE